MQLGKLPPVSGIIKRTRRFAWVRIPGIPLIWGCVALKVVNKECGDGNCFNTPLLFTAGCNHRKSKFGCHREEPCSSAQKAAAVARLCGAPDGPAPRRSPSGHSRTRGFHDRRRRSGRRVRPSSLSAFLGRDTTERQSAGPPSERPEVARRKAPPSRLSAPREPTFRGWGPRPAPAQLGGHCVPGLRAQSPSGQARPRDRKYWFLGLPPSV